MTDYATQMQGSRGFAPAMPGIAPAIVASAAQVTIEYLITPVSGTTEITTFKIPAGFRGIFYLRPTAAFTGATGGTAVASDGTNEVVPVGLAFTAVAGKVLTMLCTGGYIYPSYTS